MFKTTVFFFAACGFLPAQTVSRQVVIANGDASSAPQNMMYVSSGLAMPGAIGGTMSVLAHEFSFNSGKPITGAPYSAERVTEHIQTLADGNRIVNRTTTKVYRDSQGRTRTEMTLPALPGGAPAPTMITIQDPVAGVSYSLNPANKTAQRVMIKQAELPKANAKAMAALPQFPDTTVPGGAGPVVIARARDFPKPDIKTEDLGTQTFGGMAATVTRTTMTIPAGAIGNEQPIQTTSERWFSPELQVLVKSTNTDPRMGQTTETLNNVNRAEPDASLFQVPSDYTISDSKVPGVNTFFFKQQP